jgi:hypothetical protein
MGWGCSGEGKSWGDGRVGIEGCLGKFFDILSSGIALNQV